jgi:hypothetical protein
MKKFFASVGFAVLGASTLHAQYAPGLTPQEMAKPWSVAASLRGFYDDNYLTLPNAAARSSYGFEVSPSAALNHSVEQTSVSASYVYDLQYYLDRSTLNSSHQFNARLNHTFSERYNMAASETFVYASEPTVIDPAITSSPLRTSGNNIHNTGMLSGTAELSKQLDLQAIYQNDLYAYQQTYGDVVNPPGGNGPNPSRSALLDRMEQVATLNLMWKVQPDLTGVLGYKFSHFGYTSSEPVIFGTPNIYSQIRNYDAHFIFVGLDKDFNAQLHGSIRAGGEYLDYYNAHATDTSPYVDANMTWQYMQDSQAQAGVRHIHSATDVVGAQTADGRPVLDSETTAAYLSLNQKISGDLSGSAQGQFQHSLFNGGSVNNQSENFFIAGLNLQYHFSPYLNAEAGYNWNKLVSDLSGRDYTRNVVYIGVRATY